MREADLTGYTTTCIASSTVIFRAINTRSVGFIRIRGMREATAIVAAPSVHKLACIATGTDAVYFGHFIWAFIYTGAFAVIEYEEFVVGEVAGGAVVVGFYTFHTINVTGFTFIGVLVNEPSWWTLEDAHSVINAVVICVSASRTEI